MAPSQFTDFGLKLLSPIWFNFGSAKLLSPIKKTAMIRTDTVAISTNAMMLKLITH